MKKFLFLSAAAVILFTTGTALQAADTIRDFELEHVKIPVYQKSKLQFIIFADTGRRRGNIISGRNTLIDRLLENSNVDKIPDGWQERIYPLNSKLPAVVYFWQRRFRSSEAVLFTSICQFDRKNNVVYGSENVLMRTPMFDLDGIGFRANLAAKEIEINADIKIIARRDDSDPREILTGKRKPPAQYTTVHAIADSLRLDMEHNELMLIGNVEVIDGKTTLNCDRLTIFMKGKNAPATAAVSRPAADTGDSSSMLKGISRILADGEVVLRRRPENSRDADAVQTAWCDHLEYEFDSGRIILTGDDSLPKLTQGNHTLTGERIELLRFSRKAFVNGRCRIEEKLPGSGKTPPLLRSITSDRADFDDVANLNIFTGNVQLNDGEATLNCQQMPVFLKPGPARSKAAGKTGSNEFSPASGSRELERIFCDGAVRIVSRTAPGKTGQKKPETPSILTAGKAELDYPADKLVFHDRVHVLHRGDTLDCDRLDLFLSNSKFKKSSGTAGRNLALGGSPAASKILSKVIASGKVNMKDQESDLATELLTLDFQELPPGKSKTPGMFTASNVQLIRIICDGKVSARSLPGQLKKESGKTRILKAEHAMSDLLKNRSEFHKNVSLQENENELFCRDMYVYTGPAVKMVSAPVSTTAAADDPDADPFELVSTENAAPSRIALSDGIDLQRIVCKNHVRLCNRDRSGKLTWAGGDTAIYTVEKAEIIITADAPERPYLERDNRRQYSDFIRADLKNEILEGSGNVQVIPVEEAPRKKGEIQP